MKNDIVKRATGVTRLGIVGGITAPLLGWALSGWNNLEYYLKNQTVQVLVWVVIGFLFGNIAQLVLEKLDVIGKREHGKDDEKSK